MNNENIMLKAFIDIIKFLNNSKSVLYKKLLVKNYQEFQSSCDNDIFFLSGQLLAVLYIFNVNGLTRNDIKYKNGVFYIKNLFKKEIYISEVDSDCIKIAQNIIDKSIYNKVFLPYGIEINNYTQYQEVEQGFIEVYKILLNKKISLIKVIEKYGYEEQFYNVINNLKILNYKDLNRQIELINIKFNINFDDYKYKNRLIDYAYTDEKFISLACNSADRLIESSIIGVYNNDIEITWIGCIKNKIKPLVYKNVYIALFLGYLSKNTNDKYYLQATIQAIKPAIRYFNYDNKDDEEFKNTVNTFYMLNTMLNVGELKEFINNNNEIFKQCSINFLDKENVDRYLLITAIKTINKVII